MECTKEPLKNLASISNATERFRIIKFDTLECETDRPNTLNEILLASQKRLFALSNCLGMSYMPSITNLYDSIKSYITQYALPYRFQDEPKEFKLDTFTITVSNEPINFHCTSPPETPSFSPVSQDTPQIQKRPYFNKEARRILEKAFQLKPNPTKADREAIAQRCRLTPVQVRVWFTNKRMRSK